MMSVWRQGIIFVIAEAVPVHEQKNIIYVTNLYFSEVPNSQPKALLEQLDR